MKKIMNVDKLFALALLILCAPCVALGSDDENDRKFLGYPCQEDRELVESEWLFDQGYEQFIAACDDCQDVRSYIRMPQQCVANIKNRRESQKDLFNRLRGEIEGQDQYVAFKLSCYGAFDQKFAVSCESFIAEAKDNMRLFEQAISLAPKCTHRHLTQVRRDYNHSLDFFDAINIKPIETSVAALCDDMHSIRYHEGAIPHMLELQRRLSVVEKRISCLASDYAAAFFGDRLEPTLKGFCGDMQFTKKEAACVDGQKKT